MQSACRGWRRLLRRKGSPRKQKASLSYVSCAGKDCCLDVDVIVEVFGHSYAFNSKQLMWSKQSTPGPLSMIATTLCGPCVEVVWTLCGSCVDIVWNLCGTCVDLVWTFVHDCDYLVWTRRAYEERNAFLQFSTSHWNL